MPAQPSPPADVPHGLVDRPTSYEEMANRPRFQVVLSQKEHKLHRVLSHYGFSSLCKCGLSDCRTAHREGFLVETTDGHETNVGHVCGKKAFPDWDIKRSHYLAVRERDDLLTRARAIMSQTADIQRQISELEHARFGSRWVERVRANVSKVLGSDLFDSLQVFQRRGDFAVTVERERAAAEITDIVERTRQKREQVRFEKSVVGRLAPMPWIVFPFRGKLQDTLLVNLQRFGSLHHESVATPSLRKAVKAFDGCEQVVREAVDAATSAQAFFVPHNLELLALWVPERQVKRRQAVVAWAQSDACKVLSTGLLEELP